MDTAIYIRVRWGCASALLVTLLHLGRRNVNNMLVIRKEQNKVFEDAILESFITEMVAHTQEFSPILCNVIGEP
jgi:hypothetical protein